VSRDAVTDVPAGPPQTVSAPQTAEPDKPTEPPPARNTVAAPEKTSNTAPSAKPTARREHPQRRGKIAVVIDDAGYSLPDLDAFLRFPGKLTVAVIPALANSTEAARRVRAAGKDLLIHVPMEPTNGEDPGPLFLGTGRVDEVEALMRRFADSVPGAIGINNHMGSRATADKALMEELMRWMKREGGLFLDSRTTAETVAAEAARAHGVPYAARDVFLDVGTSQKEMLAAFRGGMATAGARGSVIMIGHVQNRGVLDILEAMNDDLAGQGFALTGLRELVSTGRER